MPQYLIIAVAVFTFFKDFFKDAFKSREVKFIVIGVAVYYFYMRTKKSEEQADIIATLPDNEAGLYAEKLFNAFHPLSTISLLGYYLPDGTDETAITTVAVEMGKKKNYQAVSDAYKLLHKNELKDDLTDEGVFDLFFNSYNTQKVVVTPPIVTPPTGGGVVTTNPKGMKKGDTVYSLGGYNLRDTNAPYAKTVYKTVKGEDWILFNNPYIATIDGQKGYWVVVQQPKGRYVFYPSYYVVFLDALYKK